MSKYVRHQSVISRQADESIEGDHWLKQFEKMQKEAVQPRAVDRSLFEQITTIMNGKPKYTSVEAAVEDMKNRSGLTAYLSKVTLSEEGDRGQTKTASAEEEQLPALLKKNKNIVQTIDNIVRESKGNLPVIAIIEKVKSIHHNDISDDKLWDGDDLIIYVSGLNLKEKRIHARNEESQNLGKSDSNNNLDIDPTNTDAFYALNPAKI
jgi:hypothetical protein